MDAYSDGTKGRVAHPLGSRLRILLIRGAPTGKKLRSGAERAGHPALSIYLD